MVKNIPILILIVAMIAALIGAHGARAAEGVLTLGNYRILIDDVMYTSSYQCLVSWDGEYGDYTISFDIPKQISYDETKYQWDGGKSTLALYNDYDQAYITAAAHEQLTGYTVTINTASDSFYTVTTTVSRADDRATTWEWLAEVIEFSPSGNAPTTYFRMAVTYEPVDPIQEKLDSIQDSLDQIIGDPTFVPQVVLVAQSQIVAYNRETYDVRLEVQSLDQAWRETYEDKIAGYTEDAFRGLADGVSSEEQATMGGFVNVLFGSGILATFLLVYAVMKVLSNMHRKMGD